MPSIDLDNPANQFSATPAQRLTALRALQAKGALNRAPRRGEVNNHVHTVYSFSPYTPSMAALCAYEAGLEAVGSVDHDSVGAARETLEAGLILGLAVTVGCEIRVSFAGTAFEKRKLNYPECLGKAYIVFHGIPVDKLDEVDAFLQPLRAVRIARTRAMTEAASAVLQSAGLPPLNFDTDVVPMTKLGESGGVTERHLCAAVATLLLAQAGSGGVVALLQKRLGMVVGDKQAHQLADPSNVHALYDLVGLLKTTLLETVFVQPTGQECPPVREAVAFARSIGAIPAYAYLGDVEESATGDKKAERFEDAYLDELISSLPSLGFQAVTYMPPRNTPDQLLRLQRLCATHGLFEISGVDINSSRQSFHCPEVLQPEFAHLNESTWALIAHEKQAGLQPNLGFFHPKNPLVSSSLAQRIEAYAAVGRTMDPTRPSSIAVPQTPRAPQEKP